jgi:hypothetical protein
MLSQQVRKRFIGKMLQAPSTVLGEQFKRSQSFRIKADQFASHYLAKPLTVAWRRNLLPAKCLTSTVSFGSHHLTSFDLELLKEAQER